MYPNYPNQPPRMGGPRRPPGYSNQPPRISGYFVQPNQPPRIVGYSGRPLMNQGYPNQYTRNIPRVPMQMAPGLISRQAHSDANCDACFDMNPRLRPQSEHTFLGPNRIMVILPKFLEASEYNNCPFCTILLDLFMAFVDNAEEKVSHAAQMDITRGSTRRLPRASVFLESGKPIEVHFREGKHATSVSYPPIQIYNPAGKFTPFSYLSINAYMMFEKTGPGQIGQVLALSEIQTKS
jgi:hypothetical protein